MNEEPARIGEAELRMALRGLRRDVEPDRDLWPGIAGRLQSLPQQPAQRVRKSWTGWLWPIAMSASVLLAVGVAWQLKPGQPAASAVPQVAHVSGASSGVPLVQREAQSMTVHYEAALRELAPQPVPAGWKPGLDALDRSAMEIRGALQHDPNSRLLLQRLRDTYTRRLALARRALYA